MNKYALQLFDNNIIKLLLYTKNHQKSIDYIHITTYYFKITLKHNSSAYGDLKCHKILEVEEK